MMGEGEGLAVLSLAVPTTNVDRAEAVTGAQVALAAVAHLEGRLRP